MIGQHWGTTSAERTAHYTCQDAQPGVLLTRGVDVTAPPAVVFRWLCQLRVAPYSYDWIDNLGHRSPRALTPGLEDLELGQVFCRCFRLHAFVPDRELTIVGLGVAMTYVAAPGRLVGAITIPSRPLLTPALAVGDLVMMRKQLRTLAALSQG